MDTHFELLNRWQHGFPLQRRPFAELGRALGLDEAAVLAACRHLLADGALSRIGGVFHARAGGDALLAAMRVPAARLEVVAAIVSAHPGVNHNYEREHGFNLWFVMTGADAQAVDGAMDALALATGLPALRLRMQRAYRIDLGFDLRQRVATQRVATDERLPPVPLRDDERPLAALVEDGLPLLARPFDAWAEALGCSPEQVLATLRCWLQQGTLRRFGSVVRHHELGFAANAMTVFDVADDAVDAAGAALAREGCVTLAYRRERAPGWPYNLYCMVHGRDRNTVRELLAGVVERSGLAGVAQALLFSRRRFKQTGARRFRATPQEPVHACT